jgi:hypothetical protein
MTTTILAGPRPREESECSARGAAGGPAIVTRGPGRRRDRLVTLPVSAWSTSTGSLDGDEVAAVIRVHVVDHGSRRGRPPGAGEPGDEHEPRGRADERRDDRREPERLDARDAGHDAADHEADATPLAEGLDPEAAEPRHRVHELGVTGLPQLLGAGGGQQPARGFLGVLRIGGVEGGLHERAVDPQPGSGPDLPVEVRRPSLDRDPEQLAEVEHALVSARRRSG